MLRKLLSQKSSEQAAWNKGKKSCSFTKSEQVILSARGQRDKWSIASSKEIVQKNCPENRGQLGITITWK